MDEDVFEAGELLRTMNGPRGGVVSVASKWNISIDERQLFCDQALAFHEPVIFLRYRTIQKSESTWCMVLCRLGHVWIRPWQLQRDV